MGRILRAKRRVEVGFKSRFYTLVARDTDEVQFSARRRRFLVDQGYEFHVVPDYASLIPENVMTTLTYTDARSQNELLTLVRAQTEETGEDEVVEVEGEVVVEKERREGGRKKHALFRGWK